MGDLLLAKQVNLFFFFGFLLITVLVLFANMVCPSCGQEYQIEQSNVPHLKLFLLFIPFFFLIAAFSLLKLFHFTFLEIKFQYDILSFKLYPS